VVVYTPSILDEGLYLANMTLPHGYFWNDIIQNPGETAELVADVSAAMESLVVQMTLFSFTSLYLSTACIQSFAASCSQMRLLRSLR